jgi:hypothetical protein
MATRPAVAYAQPLPPKVFSRPVAPEALSEYFSDEPAIEATGGFFNYLAEAWDRPLWAQPMGSIWAFAEASRAYAEEASLLADQFAAIATNVYVLAAPYWSGRRTRIMTAEDIQIIDGALRRTGTFQYDIEP